MSESRKSASHRFVKPDGSTPAGITRMRERVRELGGRLGIQSASTAQTEASDCQCQELRCRGEPQ